MTTKQRIALMADHWPAACRTQGWNSNDRRLRIEVLGRILGRKIESASEIDAHGDYDVIKRELGTLADSVSEAMDTGEEGIARRLRGKVREELLPCLALYRGGMEGAEACVREVINDKFNQGRRREVRDLDELTAAPRFREVRGEVVELPSELEQLVMTLSRVLNGKTGLRNKAGHSLHEMRVLAQVGCGCRVCADGAAQGFRLNANFEWVRISGAVSALVAVEPGELVTAGDVAEEDQPF